MHVTNSMSLEWFLVLEHEHRSLETKQYGIKTIGKTYVRTYSSERRYEMQCLKYPSIRQKLALKLFISEVDENQVRYKASTDRIFTFPQFHYIIKVTLPRDGANMLKCWKNIVSSLNIDIKLLNRVQKRRSIQMQSVNYVTK